MSSSSLTTSGSASGSSSCSAAAAAALRSTISEATLRQVLREASQGSKTTSSSKEDALEQCAVLLRRRILAEFVKRQAEQKQQQEPQRATTTTAEEVEENTDREEKSGEPICLSVSLIDEAARHSLPMRSAKLRFESEEHCQANLSCPHCRRPVDFATELCRGGAAKSRPALTAPTSAAAGEGQWLEQVSMDQDGPAASVSCTSAEAQPKSEEEETEQRQGEDARPNAYCLVLLDGSDTSFQQALVLGQALRTSGCTAKRILLHTPTVPAPFLMCLRLCWDEVRAMENRPALWDRPLENAIAAKLLVLQLVEFSKVLLLEREVLPTSSLDPLFDLPTPAAFFRRGSLTTDLDLQALQPDNKVPELERGLMLLSPSMKVFNQILRELGNASESPGSTWPPKLLPKTHCRLDNEKPTQGWRRSSRDEEMRDYLVRFYLAFGLGRWTRLPEFYRPKSPELADAACPVLWSRQPEGFQWIEAMEAPPRRQLDFVRDLRRIAACLAEVVEDNPSVIGTAGTFQNFKHLLRQVQKATCTKCRIYDKQGGAADPLTNEWLCRFCTEANAFDPSVVPSLLEKDSRALREALGPWFLRSRSQRWYGPFTNWNDSRNTCWIEFRPHGVLRVCENGHTSIGAWKVTSRDGVRELVLHMVPWKSRSEVWHTFQEPPRWSTAAEPLLKEVWREALRPLGPIRQPIDERYYCRGSAAFADGHQAQEPMQPPAPNSSWTLPSEGTRVVEGDNDDHAGPDRGRGSTDDRMERGRDERQEEGSGEVEAAKASPTPPPPIRAPPKLRTDGSSKENRDSNNASSEAAQPNNQKSVLEKGPQTIPPPPRRPVPVVVDKDTDASNEKEKGKEEKEECAGNAAASARSPPPSRAVPKVSGEEPGGVGSKTQNAEDLEKSCASEVPKIALAPTMPPPPRRAPPPVHMSTDAPGDSNSSNTNGNQSVCSDHAILPPAPTRPCPGTGPQ